MFFLKGCWVVAVCLLLPQGSHKPFPPRGLWPSLLPLVSHQAKSGFQEFPNHVNNMNPILECISIWRQTCLQSNQCICVNSVCAELAKISFHSQSKNFKLQNFGVNISFHPLAGKRHLRPLSYISSFFPVFKTFLLVS